MTLRFIIAGHFYHRCLLIERCYYADAAPMIRHCCHVYIYYTLFRLMLRHLFRRLFFLSFFFMPRFFVFRQLMAAELMLIRTPAFRCHFAADAAAD